MALHLRFDLCARNPTMHAPGPEQFVIISYLPDDSRAGEMSINAMQNVENVWERESFRGSEGSAGCKESLIGCLKVVRPASYTPIPASFKWPYCRY